MTFRLIVEPAAESDIFDAFTWYEARGLGLGTRFLDSLDSAFELVMENPRAFPTAVEGVRRALTRTFPYMIFFGSDENLIHILAVINAAQDLEYVATRLDA